MKRKKKLKYFITHIKVNQTRLVGDFEIPLDQNDRKHLIITGKNGSGKTSLLREIDKIISSLNTKEYSLLGRREETLRDYILEEQRIEKRVDELQKILDIKKQGLQIVARDEFGNNVFQKSINFNFVWKKYEQEIAELKERRLRIGQRIEKLKEKIQQLSTVRIDFSNFDTLIDQIENRDFIYIFF